MANANNQSDTDRTEAEAMILRLVELPCLEPMIGGRESTAGDRV